MKKKILSHFPFIAAGFPEPFVASQKFRERVYAMLHKIITPLRIESEQDEVQPTMMFLKVSGVYGTQEMLLIQTAR
jgi:hypothetical protein